MNKSFNEEIKRRPPVEGQLDDAIELLYHELNKIQDVAPLQLQHDYQKAIQLLLLTRMQSQQQQRQARPAIRMQPGNRMSQQVFPMPIMYPALSTRNPPVFLPSPSFAQADPFAITVQSPGTPIRSEPTSATTASTSKRTGTSNMVPNPTLPPLEISKTPIPTVHLPSSPSFISMPVASQNDGSILVPDPFTVRYSNVQSHLQGITKGTVPNRETFTTGTPSMKNTKSCERVQKNRRGISRKGNSQQDQDVAKLEKARRLLNTLLNNITIYEQAKLNQIMDAIQDTNALILPALVHPEPLKQAKVSRFMPPRMKIARALLVEFQSRFNRTPGAMELLEDRLGKFPRYLW